MMFGFSSPTTLSNATGDGTTAVWGFISRFMHRIARELIEEYVVVINFKTDCDAQSASYNQKVG